MSDMNMPERPNKQQFFNDYIDFSISEDKMIAEMIYSIYPIDTLQKSDFLLFLNRHNVTYGIEEQLLDEVCQHPAKFTGKILSVARGTLPENGKDACITWNFEYVTSHENKADTDDQAIDFKELKNVINVKTGELLATKTPFTEGRPGTTVLGQKIEARNGRNIPIKIGKNVVLDETGLKAYAAIDGQVSFTENEKINVFPVYEVKGDVDYSVGNIDFVGSVVIRGNVLAGFTVRAGGDIRILGEVEGADLEAQGNIEIRAGVFGQGKGSIKAGHNLVANYINQANVHAKNDIIVGSIMHSSVKSDHKIICRRNKGLIVGGRIQAGELIDVNVIGNVGQTPTVLEVGISPDLINEYAAIKEKIVQLESDLDKANKALAVLNRQLVEQRGSLPPDKMALRNNLSAAVITIEKGLPELQHRKVEIEESLEMISQARINVQSIAFPGTKLVFGKYVRYLKNEYSRMTFYLQEGEITAQPL